MNKIKSIEKKQQVLHKQRTNLLNTLQYLKDRMDYLEYFRPVIGLPITACDFAAINILKFQIGNINEQSLNIFNQIFVIDKEIQRFESIKSFYFLKMEKNYWAKVLCEHIEKSQKYPHLSYQNTIYDTNDMINKIQNLILETCDIISEMGPHVLFY